MKWFTVFVVVLVAACSTSEFFVRVDDIYQNTHYWIVEDLDRAYKLCAEEDYPEITIVESDDDFMYIECSDGFDRGPDKLPDSAPSYRGRNE